MDGAWCDAIVQAGPCQGSKRMTLGQTITQQRKLYRHSRRALGAMLGVSGATIGHWEHDIAPMTDLEFASLCSILNIEPGSVSHSTDISGLGAALKADLKKNSLTQKAFAEKLGMSQQA